jgi:hypothetical protein
MLEKLKKDILEEMVRRLYTFQTDGFKEVELQALEYLANSYAALNTQPTVIDNSDNTFSGAL